MLGCQITETLLYIYRPQEIFVDQDPMSEIEEPGWKSKEDSACMSFFHC
jgi:hypothetical protein